MKIALAGCVLGAAGVLTWAVASLRDGRRSPPSGPAAASDERRQGDLLAPRPPARPGRSASVRSGRPAGRPVGAPQVMPPARPVFSTGSPAAPAPPRDQPPRRSEEVAARRVLEPLIARRSSAEMPFVRCLDPGGWRPEAASQAAEAEATTSEGQDPLAVPSRDPAQAVCRARLRARDVATLTELLRDASGAYQGHLVATDPREHLDAYLGRWFESDVQLDTEEAYPLPSP